MPSSLIVLSWKLKKFMGLVPLMPGTLTHNYLSALSNVLEGGLEVSDDF